MYHRKLILIMGVLLILLAPGVSNASLIRNFLKFAEDDNHINRSIQQMAPSPSPVPSIDSNSSGPGSDDNFGGGSDGTGDQVPSTTPKPEPIDGITDERCEMSLSKLCRDLKNMTACLPNAGSGPQGLFLIVQNDEENSLKVHLTMLPMNITFKVIDLKKHQGKKIDISANVGGSQSIVLNAGNGDCEIHMGSPAPEDDDYNLGNQIPSGATTYVKPMHGAYLLVLIVLISGGGACACFFKLRKRERHLDGVPYQELEMGQPESLSAVKAETAVGWDQDWDDDWEDEEKAVVMSPGGKHLSNGQANGQASRFSNGEMTAMNRWGCRVSGLRQEIP